MRIVFSCGDVNGIGLEIFYKVLKKNSFSDKLTLCINKKSLIQYYELLKFQFQIEDNTLLIGENEIQLIDCNYHSEINFGKLQKESGLLAIESLEQAAKLCDLGEYDALVTLPIHKETMYLADWKYIGHTDFLEELYSDGKTQMILFHKNLRVTLVTIHIPISEVSNSITIEKCYENISAFNYSLELNFGIENPKIAILGLNPHSGENGSFGNEEINIISPAIKLAKVNNIIASGPYASDGFFGFGDYKNFDGVIAMYHDQGLIPLKLYAEGGGVNFTSGLKIIRTSPDHGTAMEIAGKGIANEKSLLESIIEANKIFNKRVNYGTK